MSYEDTIRHHARLIALQALAGEVGGTLNSELIREHLRVFGIRKDRAWLHDELRWLAERGALVLTPAGDLLVAALAEKGQRHLDREIAIEGVRRPDLPVA